MKKILIPEDIAESGKKYLLDRGYSLKVGISTDIDTLRKEIMDVDGLIVRNARYPKEVFEDSRKLKVIARHGTGVDNIDVRAAESMGIWVVNGPLANINTVAEYTIAQIMALNCGLLKADIRTRAKDWTYRLGIKRNELKGSTLGLIGYGNIGKLVASKASQGLQMKVIAYDIRSDSSGIEGVDISHDLNFVLGCSDFISLHIPSTESTRGMFNYELLKKMKPGSYFINSARGDLYIEKDLIRVLEEGYLRGAALDVYQQEPLKESRLLTLEQVILSQHNAGLSEESKEKMSLYAAMGADEVLTGKAPAWPANHPTVQR